jgi:hypothetical protein
MHKYGQKVTPGDWERMEPAIQADPKKGDDLQSTREIQRREWDSAGFKPESPLAKHVF